MYSARDVNKKKKNLRFATSIQESKQEKIKYT